MKADTEKHQLRKTVPEKQTGNIEKEDRLSRRGERQNQFSLEKWSRGGKKMNEALLRLAHKDK